MSSINTERNGFFPNSKDSGYVTVNPSGYSFNDNKNLVGSSFLLKNIISKLPLSPLSKFISLFLT